jgi:hypothetical protein
MVTLSEPSSMQVSVDLVTELHKEISDAIYEGNLSRTNELICRLCELKGPEHVAGALTVGGVIASRVRRAAKRLGRSADVSDREDALAIVRTLITVSLYAPDNVVSLHPRVGFARL